VALNSRAFAPSVPHAQDSHPCGPSRCRKDSVGYRAAAWRKLRGSFSRLRVRLAAFSEGQGTTSQLFHELERIRAALCWCCCRHCSVGHCTSSWSTAQCCALARWNLIETGVGGCGSQYFFQQCCESGQQLRVVCLEQRLCCAHRSVFEHHACKCYGVAPSNHSPRETGRASKAPALSAAAPL
jgi:hypothetical protein